MFVVFNLFILVLCMSVKSPLGLVLYCYLNMPTINKTDLILSYLNTDHTKKKTDVNSGACSRMVNGSWFFIRQPPSYRVTHSQVQ
jgi:hypothetical protein